MKKTEFLGRDVLNVQVVRWTALVAAASRLEGFIFPDGSIKLRVHAETISNISAPRGRSRKLLDKAAREYRAACDGLEEFYRYNSFLSEASARFRSISIHFDLLQEQVAIKNALAEMDLALRSERTEAIRPLIDTIKGRITLLVEHHRSCSCHTGRDSRWRQSAVRLQLIA